MTTLAQMLKRSNGHSVVLTYELQYRFPSLIQPLNSSLTHYSLALRYRGGTGTITQWIDNWNYWNDIGHTIPLHAGNRRAPEKSLNSGDFFLQGRRRRSGRTASAGPLFWTIMLSAVSLFSRFGSFFFVLTSDFQFIDAIINNARCACHP